ncbi:MAG TPA: alpha/beta fold hydrolase [Gemmatimonadaceae bacterium]|nr:alpha/beta fold hydrolase [Gemmatimonadaceae bacterium]
MLWTLIAAAGVAALAMVALTLLVWWKQESILFQPPAPPFPQVSRVTATRVDYAASDGQPLYGYLVGDRERARGVLVAFHGNADLAGWLVPWAAEVARRTGWLVLAAEYRGYGGLDGAPSYQGSRLDARAAYAVARDSLGFAPDRIAIFGHSLGSAVATELAAEVKGRPRALLLQSPFSSARAMARVIVWRPVLVMWRVISRIHFDTERRVRDLPIPLWVAHGDRDLIIPVRMGRAVFAAAHTPGELLIVSGAGHNDVEERGGDAYWRWVEGALK